MNNTTLTPEQSSLLVNSLIQQTKNRKIGWVCSIDNSGGIYKITDKKTFLYRTLNKDWKFTYYLTSKDENWIVPANTTPELRILEEEILKMHEKFGCPKKCWEHKPDWWRNKLIPIYEFPLTDT